MNCPEYSHTHSDFRLLKKAILFVYVLLLSLLIYYNVHNCTWYTSRVLVQSDNTDHGIDSCTEFHTDYLGSDDGSIHTALATHFD